MKPDWPVGLIEDKLVFRGNLKPIKKLFDILNSGADAYYPQLMNVFLLQFRKASEGQESSDKGLEGGTSGFVPNMVNLINEEKLDS